MSASKLILYFAFSVFLSGCGQFMVLTLFHEQATDCYELYASTRTDIALITNDKDYIVRCYGLTPDESLSDPILILLGSLLYPMLFVSIPYDFAVDTVLLPLSMPLYIGEKLSEQPKKETTAK